MSVASNRISPEAADRLKAFKREVEKALPGQVTEMRLFGSRARGDATEDSDYDVAVFLRGNADRFETLRILSDIAFPHMLGGYDISALGFGSDYLSGSDNVRTELADEIMRDGIVIE